jgi:hypothetical protein
MYHAAALSIETFYVSNFIFFFPRTSFGMEYEFIGVPQGQGGITYV